MARPTTSLDVGICKGNYHDYIDDEMAIQREFDIIDDVKEGRFWEDPDFPANSSSLYFDPFNPPKGLLPERSLGWRRIAMREVPRCANPTTLVGDHRSPVIVQGTLGNRYFVNALRLLACYPHYIKRLLVSEKYKDRGMYTIKFFKEGKWRYVHIDDRIPCTLSNKVNFSRNRNPNELFVMLIEKAYAKLHGCYEAIANGLIDKVLQELCAGAHVDCIRLNTIKSSQVCDQTWELIERSLNENRPVGCARAIQFPYADNPTNRKGITLGCMYQVIDAVVVSAEPTEELDAVTVGMVCVRNVQEGQGRYTGRWSFQDELWAMYPEIGNTMRTRTREIQHKRGLGLPVKEYDDSYTGLDMYKYLPMEEIEEIAVNAIRNENDDHQLAGFAMKSQTKISQPTAPDLHWIQIEDFVDVFNRLYIVCDQSMDERCQFKRLISRWVPGDYLVGSGGPPVVIAPPEDPKKKRKLKEFVMKRDEDDEYKPADADVKDPADLAEGIQSEQQLLDRVSSPNTKPPEDKVNSDSLLADALVGGVTAEEAEDIAFDDVDDDFGGNLDIDGAEFNSQEGDDHLERSDSFGDLLEAADAAIDADEDEVKDEVKDPLDVELSESFTDNPMWPISVGEACTVSITLHQADRRWSTERLGTDSTNVTSSLFANRDDRLKSCLVYPIAIGFILVKLSGSKMRVTDFKVKKIAAKSPICYSNTASASVDLKPGRYAIIPFTHYPLSEAMDYMIHLQFMKGTVEFEAEDLVAQRLMDNVLSDDEESDDEYDDDDDDRSPAAIQRKRAFLAARAKIKRERLAMLPDLHVVKEWEFHEETEELGVVNMYDEVGHVARYVRDLSGSIDRNAIMIAKLQEELAELKATLLAQKELESSKRSLLTTTPKSKSSKSLTPKKR